MGCDSGQCGRFDPSRWRHTRRRKRPPFPLGCAIILYQMCGLGSTAIILGYTKTGVRYQLAKLHIKMRRSGRFTKEQQQNKDAA
jgi:hypothetical protein